MSVRVKICGITNQADALAAVAAGVDALGFIFVPGTPRFGSVEQAAAIIRELPPFVAKVALFVDADTRTVAETIARTGVDTIQLHGDETPEFARQFVGAVKVIKAFRVRGAETLVQLPAFADAADALLLDAYVPGVKGGTGARFDWEHAASAKTGGKPVILAGGLTPENVAEAVRGVRPFAVDVSSGVEAAPGRKDLAKVIEFIRAAKTA
ncbi:MAG TPA: phosphoribosylanthranilate isomerase [Candidatus Limnocylindria bacterium]|jgi:phosphoribosylanthranilate isomerase|nr:phosphoribosylanthranilate isomerase [Candidatus Limnocylindria bacterium]